MRALITLSIAQTLLLALLGLRVMALNGKVDTISETSLDVLAATAQVAQTSAAPLAPITYASGDLSADEVRQIMREEIAALPAAPASIAGAPQKPRPAQAAPHARAQVERELDAFIARGAIGPADMANLQVKIARLSENDRSAMLSKLAKALSAGDIDGEL